MKSRTSRREWRASPALDRDGSGGLDSCEGVSCRVPGDCNDDDRLGISDAICLLGHLFLGTPPRLPCGAGGREEAGNTLLLDWQPDGRVDISDATSLLNYLFSGGPPHTLAAPGEERTRCVPIADCR